VKPVFAGPEAFRNPSEYQLLPFRFMDLQERKLVVNLVGEHELLSNEDFTALV